MKYKGVFNLDLLHEELAFLVRPGPSKELEAHYRVDVLSDGVGIYLDDEADRTDVDLVVASHNPSKKSQAELKKEKLTADKAEGLAKLRALGLTDDQLRALGILKEVRNG